MAATNILLHVLSKSSFPCIRAKAHSPVMPDSLSTAVVFRPSGTNGCFPREPFFELLWLHVDKDVEFPEVGE